MKEFLEKISSYNIFNNLLPGILFVVIAKETTSFSFIRENIFEGAFLYYFIGLFISRVGSLWIEPFLKKIKVVKFWELLRIQGLIQAEETRQILGKKYNNGLRKHSHAVLEKTIEDVEIKPDVMPEINMRE